MDPQQSAGFTGIPADAFEYVLGTAPQLEWIVDQYRCETESGFQEIGEGKLSLFSNFVTWG